MFLDIVSEDTRSHRHLGSRVDLPSEEEDEEEEKNRGNLITTVTSAIGNLSKVFVKKVRNLTKNCLASLPDLTHKGQSSNFDVSTRERTTREDDRQGLDSFGTRDPSEPRCL